MSAEENSPVDCFRRRGQGAKRREGIRQYAEKIPNSPPKREVMLWHCFSFFVWDSNKEGADLSAEENSPADCFRRRGQGAKRREGHGTFLYPSPCNKGRLRSLLLILSLTMKFTFCFSTLKILMIITFGAEYSWPPS